MKIDFNDNWTFCKEGGEVRAVNLPHDAMLTEKRYAACPNGIQSGYFPGGKYRYAKNFVINDADADKNIKLLFEGVYRNAVVSVNGKVTGRHRYGYGEFYIDISQAVQAGENIVEVSVDNSLTPNCRWYTGSGIYRPVWLIVEDKNALTEPRIRTLSYSPAVIEVTAQEDSQIEIYDGAVLVTCGSSGSFSIPNAKLWSAETPYLYTCVTKRSKEEIKTAFGIRKIELSAKTGLLVNGAETKLRGGCIHSDNGVLGACSYPDAEERKVKILKENGFNALLAAHNPCSRAFLDSCDRLGMYVIDQAFDGWYVPKDYHDYSRDFWDNYQNDLAAMVNKDFNRPSVIMYSLGNEVTETAEKKGVQLCGQMRDILHHLDDTRPATCGINVLLDVYTLIGIGVYKDKGIYEAKPVNKIKSFKEKKVGSAFFNSWTQKLGKLFFALSKGRLADKVVSGIAPTLDIIGFNYATSRYDKDVARYPSRLMLGTETMAADLPYNWQRVKKYKQVLGDFVWSAWDYLGETCMGWIYHSYKGLPLLANQGMMDITGNACASMHFLRIVWGLEKIPFIGVRPLNHYKETPQKGAWQFTDCIESWNWQGCEGKKATVEVYADAYAVCLALNGKTVGKKHIKDYKAIFAVNYQRGTLTAVALDKNGNEVSRSSLSSGNDIRLKVKADRATLNANNQDLAYLEIEFTDEKGNIAPYIEQRVELQVEGNSATLAGFGSALYKTDEVFDKTYHDSYRGRALAVLRAANRKGKVKITAKSDGFESVTAEIEVI